jgi:hypothetical protein
MFLLGTTMSRAGFLTHTIEAKGPTGPTPDTRGGYG